MLLTALLVPVSMIGFGRRFLRRPPERINAVFGYRSARSMQSEDTWHFAHAHCGALWQKLGWSLLALSAVAMGLAYNAPMDRIGMFGGGLCLLQCAVLLLSILPTERALKRTFDAFGRRREDACSGE